MCSTAVAPGNVHLPLPPVSFATHFGKGYLTSRQVGWLQAIAGAGRETSLVPTVRFHLPYLPGVFLGAAPSKQNVLPIEGNVGIGGAPKIRREWRELASLFARIEQDNSAAAGKPVDFTYRA